MKLAYILYDKLTLLDFIGFYDPISRLQSRNLGMNYMDIQWDICGMQPTIKDSFGLTIQVEKIQPNLSDYDAVFIPGGFGTRELVQDEAFMDWIKTVNPNAYHLSVCTGSFIWAAAGFLKGKKATTHFDGYDFIANYCDTVIKDRIVQDGKLITAGAVASSLDLGLYLCKLWAGEEAMEEIQKRMDYYPPS